MMLLLLLLTKELGDIADTTSRKMRVREKNTARNREIGRRRRRKRKEKEKNRVPNMSSQGKKAVAMVLLV